MNTWLIVGIVVGILAIAGIAVVNAVADNSEIQSVQASCGESCGNSCTAQNNCGLESCGAKQSKTCSCGK